MKQNGIIFLVLLARVAAELLQNPDIHDPASRAGQLKVLRIITRGKNKDMNNQNQFLTSNDPSSKILSTYTTKKLGPSTFSGNLSKATIHKKSDGEKLVLTNRIDVNNSSRKLNNKEMDALEKQKSIINIIGIKKHPPVTVNGLENNTAIVSFLENRGNAALKLDITNNGTSEDDKSTMHIENNKNLEENQTEKWLNQYSKNFGYVRKELNHLLEYFNSVIDDDLEDKKRINEENALKIKSKIKNYFEHRYIEEHNDKFDDIPDPIGLKSNPKVKKSDEIGVASDKFNKKDKSTVRNKIEVKDKVDESVPFLSNNIISPEYDPYLMKEINVHKSTLISLLKFWRNLNFTEIEKHYTEWKEEKLKGWENEKEDIIKGRTKNKEDTTEETQNSKLRQDSNGSNIRIRINLFY